MTDEEKIWALEEVYIETHLRADHDALRSLFHQDFLMRATTGEVIPFSGTEAYLHRLYANPNPLKFELEPQGFSRTGDIAVVQCCVRYFHSDRDQSKPVTQIHSAHIWKLVGETWKLLGGMNARV